MTFEEFLKQRKVDADTVQQALRLYLSEVTNDLPADEMRAQLYAATKDRGELGKQLAILESDSAAAESAALEYFKYEWADERRHSAIRTSVENAKVKLPVVEAGLIALVAMYGMYLIATDGGKIEEIKSRKKSKNGRVEEYSRIKREPFGPIGKLVTKLFGK